MKLTQGRGPRPLRLFALVATCLCALIVMGGCSSDQEQIIEPAPDFTVTTLAGNAVSLSSLRGKVVLVDFWASWCPPCRDAMPHIVQMQNEYGPEGFQVIGLTMDDDIPKLNVFLTKMKVNYPIAVVGQGTKFDYRVSSIPHAFMIDKKGMIRGKFLGFSREIGERMDNLAKELLAESGS